MVLNFTLRAAKLVALACAPALAIAASPLAAQDADGEEQFDENTIVVEGQRVESRDVRNTARDITMGSQAVNQPLPRFQRPVCPGVWGLTPVNAQSVIDRIFENAEAAGIDINETPQCDANVWVIVVDDPAATFDQLREDRSFMTRNLERYQLRKVAAQEGSARAWNVISTRNREGQPVPTGFQLAALANDARAAGDPLPANPVSYMSRLETGVRMDIELSVVLIQRSAMASLDTYSIADYATMRLFSYTEPPSEEGPVATVLTLFEPGMADLAPQRMTAFDMAYLQALYRSDEMRPARQAIGSISDLIRYGAP